MGLFFIGLGEFICLIAFLMGVLWLILNFIRKRKKNKPMIAIACSAIGLFVLVFLSGVLYSDEMEQQRLVRESERAEEESMKQLLKELEEAKISSEEVSMESPSETESTEKSEENIEINEQSKEVKESSEETQTKVEESTKEKIENDVEESMVLAPEIDTEASLNDKLLNDLRSILSEDIANKAYDILVNQIGFSNVEFVGKSLVGDSNYEFSSDKYDFTMTASDDVYRVFQPSGGFVFYEDGEVKNSVSDAESKTIDHDDIYAYYIMAQAIVESGLKNPKSADFPSIVTRPEEIAVSKNEDIIAMQSYVDAQNSFGATVRSEWLVEFRVIDLDTYSYEPIYVNVDGEVLYGEYIDLN